MNYTCTFNEEKPELITQKLFICTTCHFLFGETICEGCANLCHSGHELTCIGYKIGYCRCGQGSKACHCYCKHPVPNLSDIGPNDNRQCLSYLRGHSGDEIKSVQCNTCQFEHPCWICDVCLKYCHANHPFTVVQNSRGYCRCNEVTDSHRHCPCLIHEDSPYIEPLPVCTALLFSEDRHQNAFYCNTCDPGHNNPICRGCYNQCHKGHQKVAVLESSSFICNCSKFGVCSIIGSIEPAA